jgi:hypothetical protein
MTQVPYTFGNESSPIPLSQLDANFAVTPQFANTAGNVVNAHQANITSVGTLTALSVSGNINGGNLRTTGSVSATGNIAAGNIATGGVVSAFGTVTGGAFTTTGNVTGSNIFGNIVAANITASGSASVTGNIAAQGIISATGNIVTAGLFVGNFLGNITGNISAGGSNTQVFFNLNGNVGAVGGLTYDKDSNVLTVLGRVNTQTFAVTGVATAPTAAAGTANNQIATTGFVNNLLNAYANTVDITGGNITANNITATTISTTSWTIREYSGILCFQFSGSNVAKLDSAGNFTTIGNVTGFGPI